MWSSEIPVVFSFKKEIAGTLIMYQKRMFVSKAQNEGFKIKLRSFSQLLRECGSIKDFKIYRDVLVPLCFTG